MKNIELLLHQYEYGQQLISQGDFMNQYDALPEKSQQLYRLDFLDSLIPLLGNKLTSKKTISSLSDTDKKWYKKLPKKIGDKRSYAFFSSLSAEEWRPVFEILLNFFQSIYYPLFLASDKNTDWMFRDYSDSQNREKLLFRRAYYALKNLRFCCERFADRVFMHNMSYPNIRIIYVMQEPHLIFRVTYGYEKLDFFKLLALPLYFCPECGAKLSSFYKNDIRYAHEIEGVTFT